MPRASLQLRRFPLPAIISFSLFAGSPSWHWPREESASSSRDGGSQAAPGVDVVPDEPSAEENGPREIQVGTAGNRFQPSVFVIKVGQTVKFIVHGSDVNHTFTIKTRKGAAEDLFHLDVPAGKTVEGTFTGPKPAALHLSCKDHERSGMTGRIRVR